MTVTNPRISEYSTVAKTGSAPSGALEYIHNKERINKCWVQAVAVFLLTTVNHIRVGTAHHHRRQLFPQITSSDTDTDHAQATVNGGQCPPYLIMPKAAVNWIF
jgi:hypothetical protein